MTTQELGQLFRKYEVKDVTNIREFLDKYYKSDRYVGRGADYASCLLASHSESFNTDGWDIISKHDSVTGKVVALFRRDV